MTERFMVDDAGTLIDMTNRNTYDYVSDVCDLLNDLHEENQQIKQRLSNAEKVNTGLIDENHRLRLTIIHSSDLNFDINWLKENLNKWRDMDD